MNLLNVEQSKHCHFVVSHIVVCLVM